MRSLETIQTLTKIGKILSKIAFVFPLSAFAVAFWECLA